MTTTASDFDDVGSMVVKLKFLSAMLSSMTPDDANFYLAFNLNFLRGNLTIEDLERLDGLYKKFDR
jgi:hypothetical protein